ncbi:MAG TPA: hypothetical protein VHG71_02145 [Verrucomicrobiae bacterium]|nr:hypothetical protein [Verrucomicrobiae bacterium]
MKKKTRRYGYKWADLWQQRQRAGSPQQRRRIQKLMDYASKMESLSHFQKRDILEANKILIEAGWWSRRRRANVLRVSFTTLYRWEKQSKK